MKKFGLILTALAAVFIMMGGTAHAQKRAKVTVTPAPWYWPWTAPWQVRDPVLAGSNFVVGAGATALYFGIRADRHVRTVAGTGNVSPGGAYALATVGCAAVSPIVGTVVTGRQLTQREVFVSTANCVVPIAGGWAMNYWFDYYGWDRPKGKSKKG